MVVLTGKESGEPTVPAQGIVLERQDRCIPPVCGGPDTCSWPKGTLLYENSSSLEQTRDKVRRRFTLSVIARFGGTTGQAATGSGNGGGPDCCRRPRLT